MLQSIYNPFVLCSTLRQSAKLRGYAPQLGRSSALTGLTNYLRRMTSRLTQTQTGYKYLTRCRLAYLA